MFINKTLNARTMNETNSSTFDYPIMFFSNDLERACFIYYGVLILLFGTVLNSLVIYLTYKHCQFHEPYMIIRAAYAGFDMAWIWGMVPIVICNVLIKDIPELLTCLFNDFSIGAFYCTVHIIALIAFERYYYFCWPMKYERYFSCKNITRLTFGLFIVNEMYMFGTEFIFGRKLKSVMLMCQLDEHRLSGIHVSILYYFG